MATSSNLSSILRFYAEKQKSPFIDFKEFCLYVKKYAEHHVEENSELVKYLGDPSSTVEAELKGLEEKNLVAVINQQNKKVIVTFTFYAVKYANQYKEILSKVQIPYPVVSEFPKQFPTEKIPRKQDTSYIPELIENQNVKSPLLYIMDFTKELPSVILPACVPIKVLLETAQKKIRKIMKKEDLHDYFLKKLRSSSQGKEITIRNFYSAVIDNPREDFIDFTEGDDYYIWNQLCYYIRQDFEKIQDKTIEDINILQAISISEIYSTYLKNKFQDQKKKEEALKELRENLNKSPFIFTIEQIIKFKDQNGRLLYGIYNGDDLKEFLQKESTNGNENQLPELLVFKVESGTSYYIYKKNVIHLIVRLSHEAHDSVEEKLVNKWYKALLEYQKLPEMNDQNEFELCLEKSVKSDSPVLYALLNANFTSLLEYEKNEELDSHDFQLFANGKLMPYSELLMLKNSSIMAKAKIKLPFIYTIPLISWIISLIKSGKKKNSSKNKTNSNSQKENENYESLLELEDEKNSKSGKKLSKPEALAAKARELTSDFIPEGSTLDRELNFLTKQWNKMISKEAYNNLTEDVNSLIRDYTRRVVKTLSTQSFTKQRIENLAVNLVKTPNMQKIGEEEALTEYVELYILRLVSNTKKSGMI